MNLENTNQENDYLGSQPDANATSAAAQDNEIDADFDVEDELENQVPTQEQNAVKSFEEKQIVNNGNEVMQNQAEHFSAEVNAGYQPLADAPENIDEDSNMGDHLPPIENQAMINAGKTMKKAEKLRKELETLKQLSLDEKLALLKKYNPTDFYKIEHFVDACDTTDAFCLAKIIQIDGSNVQVNFDGWSSKWDTWYRAKSSKVAPFRTQHQGYSGQVKTAIRGHLEQNLQEMRLYRKQIDTMIADDLESKSAHDTTQYLRGHLYTYSDFLLGLNFDKTSLPEVIDFQKAVMRLVVTYLKKITTMQKTIYEQSQNHELFLVDQMCAILASYPELSDMLKRLFACCQRALRFYLFNDIDQVQPEMITSEVMQQNYQIIPNTFGVVVQDFTSIDFESRRIHDEAKYMPDASRIRIAQKDNLVFGQMINFVQYFADIGGFNAILNLLKLGFNQTADNLKQIKEESTENAKKTDYSSQKIDLGMIQYLILPLRNLGSILKKEFKDTLCKTIQDLIAERLMNMSEKNLKDVDKDSISTLINSLKQFLLLNNSESETAQIIETTQLFISLKFLKCGNLEKRLKGLNDIRFMVERVISFANKRNDNLRKNKYIMLQELPEQNKVKPSEFLTIENFRDWISDNKVLEIILGGNAHIEIVKRCGPILKFMSEYGQGKFDASTVALVWKCQMGKHEEMVRTVYNLIQEVMPSLSLELVDLFYEKIKEMPAQQYDEKFLVFLREYTKMALSKRYAIFQKFRAEENKKIKQQNICHDEIEMDEAGYEDFDSELQNQENKTLSTLTLDNLATLSNQDVNHFYGLPIFWSICQDQGLNSLSFSADQKHIEILRQLSLNSMLEMFNQRYRKQIRLTYLLKSIRNIMQNSSLVQSLQVATTIIKSFYIDQMHQVRRKINYGGTEDQEIDEETKQPEQLHIIMFFQQQLKIMDALIENIELYHTQVKQKMKVFVEKNRVPQNVEEQIFVGQYSNIDTLNSILEFIEYVVIQSQNDSLQVNDVVQIGIENIKKLWHLFVTEPNFNTDQNLFLNWINKQRFQNVREVSANQFNQNQGNQLVGNEQHIFTEDEKKFLFSNILCNPAEVDINKVSLSLVKVFTKYFRQINKAEGNINMLNKKIKVLKFNDILGIETLWKIALHSPNEKVKQVVHELLVDLHLKFDHQNVTIEHKTKVISHFIEQCMKELETDDAFEQSQQGKKGAIQLISLFLDRYEGKRPIQPEAPIAQRLNNVKPQLISVINCMDMNNKILKQIQVSYFQTLGFVRNQIAELFELQINQFIMIIKSNQIDAEIEDDIYIKDFQGLFNQITIKQNKNYDPSLHPRYLLCNNEKHFNTIFSMLRGSQANAGLTELVWALIAKLPQNENVCEQFESLQLIKLAQESGIPDDLKAAWSQLLDEKSIFKLLYCLKIINSTYMNPLFMQTQRDSDDEEASSESKNIIFEKPTAWKIQFILLGGFNHLLYALANLNLEEINCLLELVCVKTLLEILYKFIVFTANQKLFSGKSLLEQQDPSILKLIVLKMIKYIDLICKFSIQEEQDRGHSFEVIEKRIETSKLRKNRYKLLIQGNKADAVKKQKDEDDDEGNEDKKILLSLNQNFHNQVEIVNYLFNFMNQVINKLPESVLMIIQYDQLEQMFVRGMLLTENQQLRKIVCQKIADIIKNGTKKLEQPQTLINDLLQLEIKTVLPLTKENESRSLNFYDVLQDLISQLQLNDLMPLQKESTILIEQLTDKIIQREIKEQTTADRDIFLQGQMTVLARLLQKFPAHKNNIGQKLTKYLVHECLFEIPHGHKEANSAPKCKSYESRKAAFNLLATLSRDCLQNLNLVLDYMHKFSTEVSWRTKKESDWNIKFFDNEKSSTGHVGIKNLGCICYMNSLNQQLFMIPGFRNDILSIQDPNHDKCSDEDNMFLQWQTLFAGLLLSEKMFVSPKAYCHSFKDWEGEPINILEQMDVEEYLNMFMDRLENQIKGTPQAQTIQYHFGGTFANEIICKTCPHSYVRTENFLNVGVPVMNKKNLYEGLDAFVKGDMLEESNQYQCEKCEKKVDALKRTCLQKLPRYMIMTLKRFEFDLDRMVRVKLNDFYEFKEEIDVSEYTQEYLNAKERAQKVQKSDVEGEEVKTDSKEEILKTLKQPREYYQYELVGIVIHSGTADSGHYYSYIKEQEVFKKQGQSSKWYEFNDIWVRDFDPQEIPAECYGGEETAFQQNSLWNSNSQQKFLKFRNAYLLVYKRKLTDESLLVKDEIEAVSSESIKKEKNQESKYQLGSQELQLDVTSPLIKKIAADNHKYWQNRFLFGPEYFEFVQQMILYWNTNRIIPSQVSWRNNDYHLLDQVFKDQFELAKKPMELMSINDVQIDMSKNYNPQEIQRSKLQVFKFATQFYVSILQRSYDKHTLPETVKYIRTYINDDETCARWLISEFLNFDVLAECFLENNQTFMRQILAGLLYCAMLRVWENERKNINNYWEDLKANVLHPRDTILGNLILCLLQNLPKVLDYSKNQNQWFQMLARFSNLGPEARLFLLNAKAIEKCMNFFHIKDTPYQQDFLEQPMYPINLKNQLDIGKPTADDPNQKLSAYALLKEKNRQKKLHSDKPKFLYLIEIVSNCMRSLHVETPPKIKEGMKATPHQLEDSGFVLSDHETTLIMPQCDFIEKIFFSATKPRSMSAIAKGYMHWCYYNPKSLNSMWETVSLGLKKYDSQKIKSFLILFQHMLEAKESPTIRQMTGQWLEDLFQQIIPQNVNFYQWMEVIIDFVIKIGLRIPECKAWFSNNQDQWSYLFEWLKKNPEPPQATSNYYVNSHQSYQSNMRLYKNKYSKPIQDRFDKTKNQCLLFVRRNNLIYLKDPTNPNIPDFSNEIDLEQLDLTDFKYTKEMHIEYTDELYPNNLQVCVVIQDMDELLSIKWISCENQLWEAQEKNKMYPLGIIGSISRNRELKKVYEAIVNKQAQDKARIQQQQLQPESQIKTLNSENIEDHLAALKNNTKHKYYENENSSVQGSVGTQQDQDQQNLYQNSVDNIDVDDKPVVQQDAEMEFEGQNDFEYSNNYENFDALDPQSNAVEGKYSCNNQSDGSDDEMNP